MRAIVFGLALALGGCWGRVESDRGGEDPQAIGCATDPYGRAWHETRELESERCGVTNRDTWCCPPNACETLCARVNECAGDIGDVCLASCEADRVAMAGCEAELDAHHDCVAETSTCSAGRLGDADCEVTGAALERCAP